MDKSPTHYFVNVGHQNATKNKLQEEFHVYLYSLKATLITVDRLKILKSEILEKADELNKKYPRCTPLKIKIDNLHFNNGFMLSGFYSIVFQILKAYERK